MIELLHVLNKIDIMYQKNHKIQLNTLHNLYEITSSTHDQQHVMAFCHEFFVFALSVSNIFINSYELQKLILLYNSGMDIKSGIMYSKLAKEFIDNITSLNK
jgi:hypothetical protein